MTVVVDFDPVLRKSYPACEGIGVVGVLDQLGQSDLRLPNEPLAEERRRR